MKKNSLILVFITIIGAVALISTSCKKDNGPTTENFVIQIDSVIHPDTISVGEILKIKFYGTIGPNSCYNFSSWSNYFETDLIQITTIGVHFLDQDCVGSSVTLNGAEYQLTGVPAGDYTIKIVQPNDSTMNSPLHVKP